MYRKRFVFGPTEVKRERTANEGVSGAATGEEGSVRGVRGEGKRSRVMSPGHSNRSKGKMTLKYFT